MTKRKQRIFFFWLVTVVVLLVGLRQVASRQVSGMATSGDLVINEMMAANTTGLVDEDGDSGDWIELYNQDAGPINLGGWALTDDPNDPEKWPLPEINLAGRSYLVIFASGKNRTRPDGELHTNFRLQASGEFLGLFNRLDDKFIETMPAVYPAQLTDIAYGRTTAAAGYVYLAHPTPGQANDETVVWQERVTPVVFSVERGFYEQPFTVTLSSATPEAVIRYTTNGSEPTETGGALYSEPLTIAGTTLLRAAAFHPHFLPSPQATHSYLFLDNVLSQPAEPPGFPPTWGRHPIDFAGYTAGEPVRADYEVDPELVNDPRYRAQIKAGLQALPSLSIITDVQNFDIYGNPRERGVEWERPASVELLYPDQARPGFQVDAAIRIQGGAGRWEFMPKHSLRLFFKSEYGPTELDYPLFPNSPVEKFNTLVLRAGVDRSYAGHPEAADHRQVTYTRDEWLRASQIEMSGAGSHGIFVHLYLNGLYWGLYNVVERPDAAFAAAYFGGPEESWYSVNHRGGLSGSSERFKRLIELAEADQLARPEIYAEVQQLLDVEQFADYMILNWYAGTKDWPENNWYANVRNPDGQVRYFVWDGEESWDNGAEIYLGKDDLAGVPNTIKILFKALIKNPEFKLTLADRMARHLLDDGALTEANAQARWRAINEPVGRAIIGESIRWGDARYDEPIIPADWQRASEAVLAQMVGNGERLIAQARALGYYPPLDPPQVSPLGGLVSSDTLLTMTAPAGTIYFTADGSDPRQPVSGAIAPTAVAYDQPLPIIGAMQIKARVRLEPTEAGSAPIWSPLQEATFKIEAQVSRLRVTELMYHPSDDEASEFIELTNLGDEAVALAGATFNGIRYTFPPSTPPLAPAGRLVLASDEAAFKAKYPAVDLTGVFEGRLANDGEEITLSDPAGKLLLSLAFDDENGWPLSADGRGDSLILVNPDGDPNDPQNWRASSQLGGSPGQAKPASG